MPRLLDLFCCAGGCSKGYHDAGFEVAGIDIEPQPHYPYEFIQADAMEILRGLANGRLSDLGEFDAIHASPPCQMYSTNMKHLSGPQPMLIEPTRELLIEIGLPWIIENVQGSPLPDQDDLFGRFGVILCGTSFGLRVWRHRWFETSWHVDGLQCNHKLRAMNPHNVAGRERIYAEFGRQDPEVLWRNEMGVGWMGRYEAREAIPPVYAEYVGCQLLAHLNEVEGLPVAFVPDEAALQIGDEVRDNLSELVSAAVAFDGDSDGVGHGVKHDKPAPRVKGEVA